MERAGPGGERTAGTGWCSRAARVAVLVLLVLLIPSPATAHGDVRLVDEVLDLEPGGSVQLPGELHYHRLVGRLEASGEIRVALLGPDSPVPVVEHGPAEAVVLNELIRCCEEAWAPHTLVIENATHEAVTVTAQVVLVHDDLAVMVDGAEDGTRASIVLIGIGWMLLLWRRARRPATPGVPLARALVALAVVAGAVALATAYGAVRYGGGAAPALVAGLFDVPVLPVNPVVSRTSLLLWLLLLGWFWATAQWARSAPGTRPRAWLATGGLLTGAVGAFAAAVFLAYGRLDVPAAWSAVAVLPMLVHAVARGRGARDAERRPTTAAPSPAAKVLP